MKRTETITAWMVKDWFCKWNGKQIDGFDVPSISFPFKRKKDVKYPDDSFLMGDNPHPVKVRITVEEI